MKSIELPPPSEWQAWPKIYEPWSFRDMPPRFSVAAPEGIFDPEELIEVRRRNGRVPILSPRRPEVVTLEIDWLVRELARRDARNLSRDTLLAEHPLRVWYEPKPYDAYGHKGVMLHLSKVMILR